VAGIISEYINVADQEAYAGKHRLALIGPTGVGKTTTIAKLAAIASVLKEKSVALITIDTFRVGAVDQLKTYADIISVPLEVARTPKELKNLLARHSDKDLVLIDTVGRSPYNKLQIAEMKGFLDACPDVLICLVLSVATNHRDLNEIISRYGKFSIDKLVFTKLDETRRYGNLINVANRLKKGLAYVTTGQNVPDDIEVPVPANLAHLILHGGSS
jgi:flagellar biosynthesis protein FlhF